MPERFSYTQEEVSLEELEPLVGELLHMAPVDYSNSFLRHYELQTVAVPGNFPPENPQFELTRFTATQASLFSPGNNQVVDSVLMLTKRCAGDTPKEISYTCNMLTGEVVVRGIENAHPNDRCIVTQLGNMKVASALE